MRVIQLLALLLLAGTSSFVAASSGASRMPWHEYSEAEIERAIEGLRSINSPELSQQRIDALAERAANKQLVAGDEELICIGVLTGVFAVTFGIGLVPNPPWDYLFGQLPAYAANLGLKFCRPVLDVPGDIGVYPNVATAAGPTCGYTFTQPIIEATRSDFMGLPLKILGHWGFNATSSSRSFGTPSAFHYNTDVKVRMFLPGQAPPGFLNEFVDEQFVAQLTPGGILGPSLDPFATLGCLLDGSTTESVTGTACPIDLDRRITMPVGSHPITWRAETEVGLLDVLPPLYVPGTPPGSKKELAKIILKNAFDALGLAVVGSFAKSYPTGVVSLGEQQVRVFDNTVPSITLAPAFQNFRIEAQGPGGQRTTGLRDVLRPGITASDDCERVPQVSVPIAPFLGLGGHQLTWTARDAGPAPGGGANSASVVQTIIIEDTRPPQIQAPPPIVIESASAPVALDIGVPMVFDVVDLDPSIERDGPGSFPFGVTVVRWRATDASGNASPWVDQRITVKPVASNNAPVTENSLTSAVSFEETTVLLNADDADADHLFFYIDRKPDEGFFVAPLLPVFVEDLRVERQTSLQELTTHCETVNAPLPPQHFVYLPEYITVDDEGISFVIDRELYCQGPSLPRNLSSRARIARISADGELLGQYLFGSTSITKLSFHPGGLPGYEQPFVYWVDRGTERLLVLEQSLSGSVEVIRLDLWPPGTFRLNSHVDAAIDSQGIAYVTDTSRVYAYDFLTRPAGGSNGMLFLDRLGAPASQSAGDFGQAWDMDVDSQDNVYVGDWDRNRIHKFAASTLARVDGGSDVFTSGEYIGWLGACNGDSAPGGAAVCDVASGRSLGYTCSDAICSASPSSGSGPGQFNRPQGFAIDPNDILYIADRQNNRIQRFTPEGLFAGQAKSGCNGVNCFIVGQFGTAKDVSVNSTSFFVLDEDTDILHVFSANPVSMTGPTTATVTYRSFNNFIGTDSFEFFASDGLRQDGVLVRSNVATASIAVERNFRAPFATAGISAEGDEETAIPVLLDGSDPDIGDTYPWEPLDSLSFSLSTAPANGSVSIAGDIATYTPDPDWNGIDSFHFTVSDGSATSAPEEVVITVHPANDTPQLSAPTSPQVAGRGFSYALSIAVRDPDELDEHTVQVNWGDGSIESEGEILTDGTITGPLIDFNPSGDGLITAQHVYTQLGTRSVQACVTDAASAAGCTEFHVEVVAMTDLNVFDPATSPVVQPGQPVLFNIAVSNLAPEVGAGTAATGGVLDIEIDSRLSILAINPGTGVNCSGSGPQRSCTLPSLSPLPRNESADPPPIDRQVSITAILANPLPPGTLLRSSAQLSANEPNRSPLNRVALDRHVVAAADFVVAGNPADSSDVNPGDGVCADGQGSCSLRAAVQEANGLGGPRRIALSPSTYRLADGEIVVGGDIEIIGVGVGRSEIVSDGAFRIFNVQAGASLTLRDLALSGTEEIADIGGLLRNAGSLVLEDSLLQQGRAQGGGAIANLPGASLDARRSALVGNRASPLGGGAITNAGIATLENVLLFNNESNYGGAINSDPIGAGSGLTLKFCTVVGNRSSSTGAALFGNFSGAPMATLSNTILDDNVAAQPGAGGACWSQLVSAGGNIVNDDLELCSFDAQPGDQLGATARLEAHESTGARMPILQPSSASPALGAAIGDCPALDARALARPSDPAACDVGAYQRMGLSVFSSGFEL